MAATRFVLVLLAAPAALGLQVSIPEFDPERPHLLPPPDIAGRKRPSEHHIASLLQTAAQLQPSEEFRPSNEFESRASGKTASLLEEGDEANKRQGESLPWGVQSPKSHDNKPVFQVDTVAPWIDFPKEIEYSLEAGDNFVSFSSAQQDVKLITQVLENVTNGFYIDCHAGDGEQPSNTLLLELTGWRGLCLEPNTYDYVWLWSKFRKAWLFMGSISPHENFTKLGFNSDRQLDMLSGHKVHAYPMTVFLAEMGGRKTVDFWNLNNGGFEAEVLNETLLGSGKNIEFGVILVTFDGRRNMRGNEEFVQRRSRDETENMIFHTMHWKGYKYIGGLDAYWINTISPRFYYNDVVFVNPAYFEKRGIPVPQSVKSAPPPALDNHNVEWEGFQGWDEGFSSDEEVAKISAYIKKAKAGAAIEEPVPMAHRVEALKVM